VSLGKGIGSQQNQGTRLGKGERLANADRMGAQQVDLELTNLLAGNVHIAELTDSGGDRIGDFVPGNQSVDDCACADDCFASVRGEKNRAAFDRNFTHRF
jgi:hypothetical protein